MPPAVLAPPPTQSEPVTETLHGVQITDPYRWLEDQHSPRTRKWLEEQTVYTRTYLDRVPGREQIRKRVEELLAVDVIYELFVARNRYFYLKRRGYQEQPVIMMKDGQSGEEIVLVDPTNIVDGTRSTVKIMDISADGALLAYGVSTGADAFRTVEFLDVETKQVLPEHLPRSLTVQLQFSRDGRGFYYSREAMDCTRLHHLAVYWHEFGTSLTKDAEIFVAGNSSTLGLSLCRSTDGSLLGYLLSHAGDLMRFDFYIHDIGHGLIARKLVDQMESVFHPFFVGDQLFALTDWKAPNLRVVAIDIDRPAPDQWLDVVPESKHAIKDCTGVGSFVCVDYIDNLASRIEIIDRKGRWYETVPCPPGGTVQLLKQPIESDRLFYKFSSFTCPPIIFSYHIEHREQNLWSESPIKVDSSSVEVEQVSYKSKDGTEIPMFLVAGKGHRLSGSLPTFLGAYGGFGVSRSPQFNVYSTFLIEHGFLFAFAHVRGGGEFGEEWHRAAKRHNRQNAFDDFIAGAEWLISSGYAATGKIAIGGGSNAGLLTGAALTQRPDLFRVAICMGPLLDMLRYHQFDSAHLFIDEFGTADKEDDFLYLQAYSPYHRVECGVPYPAVMLISGDEDTCCNPMHARKMAARLQAATSSGHPILLDYKSTWGHVAVQPLSRRIEALTDRLGFICNELSVSI